MKPPVVPVCKLKGQLIVLVVVFSHIHMKAVAADIVERSARDADFFCAAFSADIAALDKFLPDLDEILLLYGDIQRRHNGFQVADLVFDLNGQL